MTELLDDCKRKIALAESFMWQHGITPITELTDYDTVCYRVETNDRYIEVQRELGHVAVLLDESEVNGRLISVFRLHKPQMTDGFMTRFVELPQPKPNNQYKEGIQHLQAVTADGLEVFHAKHENLPFDTSGLSNELNPLLELSGYVGLEPVTVKFHDKHMGAVLGLERRLRKDGMSPVAAPNYNGHVTL